MFKPRRIETSPKWLDPDGVKLYTISASGDEVKRPPYLEQLQTVKSQKSINWASTPSFAIFHDGVTAQYLVFAWWRNENELFTSVSVYE